MVERVARQLQTRIEDNQPHYVAWNECSIQLVAAAKVHTCTFDTMNLYSCIWTRMCVHLRLMNSIVCPQAHCDSFVCTNFVQHLEELSCSAELYAVLKTLCQLHFVCRILNSAAEYLEVRVLIAQSHLTLTTYLRLFVQSMKLKLFNIICTKGKMFC